MFACSNMFNPGDYYLVAMTLMFGAAYLGLYFLMPFLLGQRPASLTRRSLYSIFLIIGLSVLVSCMARSIADPVIANRILHALGGGFLAFLTCVLATRDARVNVDRGRFILLALLIVTALGVGNELAELALQSLTKFPFTDSLIDTWLDLLSNTTGALIAIPLIPLLYKNRP